MVVDILGELKSVPVPNELPPLEAAYQLIVPAEVEALNATTPVPHRLPGEVVVIVAEFIKNAPDIELLTDPQLPVTIQ